ncbi:MAG TPA: glycosyltransferase, partial [Spirochaetota bacterium]|nr:glycosyltransferase [Spirochaetota bacterium]
MKIAILCYHRLGGSGIIAYETGYYLAKYKKYEVHFVGLEPPFRFYRDRLPNLFFHRIYMENYPVFNYQPYTLSLASQLAELIDLYQLDIIHSHYALPHATAALLAKEMASRKVKCVTTLHGTDVTVVGSGKTLYRITKHSILNSDHVTAVSDAIKKDSEKNFNLPRDFITTVYNFINPEVFYPPPDNTPSRDKIIFTHISNLRPVKRPLDAVHIFTEINKQIKINSELWISGDG